MKTVSPDTPLANISFLTIGNVIAQGISLIGAFYIPRLLGPEIYGNYNTVLAYVGLFSIFTFSGMTKVIIRESAKDLTKIKEILEATIGLRLVCSFLAIFVSIFALIFVDYQLGLKVYISIYSIILLLQGINGSIGTVFISSQRMKILGVITTLRQLVKVPCTIILLLMHYSIFSIFIAHIVIEIAIVIILYVHSRKIIVFNMFSKIKIVKKYVLDGFNFTLLSFFNRLSTRIDLLMLSFLTSQHDVGIYALAYRLVRKSLVIRGPVSQSLFPFYSAKYSNGKPKLKELVMHSLLIILPLALLLFPALFLIEPIVIHVIGIEYIGSVNVFRVLVFYLIFNFSIIPWSS